MRLFLRTCAAQAQQAVAAAAAREKSLAAALNDANNRVQELQVRLTSVYTEQCIVAWLLLSTLLIA
jgi:hypothetical protein